MYITEHKSRSHFLRSQPLPETTDPTSLSTLTEDDIIWLHEKRRRQIVEAQHKMGEDKRRQREHPERDYNAFANTAPIPPTPNQRINFFSYTAPRPHPDVQRGRYIDYIPATSAPFVYRQDLTGKDWEHEMATKLRSKKQSEQVNPFSSAICKLLTKSIAA